MEITKVSDARVLKFIVTRDRTERLYVAPQEDFDEFWIRPTKIVVLASDNEITVTVFGHPLDHEGTLLGMTCHRSWEATEPRGPYHADHGIPAPQWLVELLIKHLD